MVFDNMRLSSYIAAREKKLNDMKEAAQKRIEKCEQELKELNSLKEKLNG